MRVIAGLYAGYVVTILLAFAVQAAFGEDHCGLLSCEPGYDYNWADTAGFVGVVLAILFVPLTVAFALAFALAAVVAARRRKRASL